MNTRSKVLVAVVLCAAGATVLGKAQAGWKQPNPVTIDTVNLYASGGLGDARNSSDTLQHIGCSVFSNGSAPSAMCYGEDAGGHQFWCGTSNAALVQVAQAVQGDSHLYVYWNSSSACTYLEVENASEFTPKAP